MAILGLVVLFFGLNYLKGLNLFTSDKSYFMTFKDISGLSNRIPKGSTAEVVSDLLGNVQVNLLLANNPREKLEPGDRIVGRVNDGAMGKLKEMIPAVERILPKLDSIMSSLNTLLADPAFAQSVHNIQQITGGLTQTTSQLNTLLAGLNKDVPQLMTNTNGVLDQANQLAGNLAQVNVGETMQKINSTLDNVQKLSAQLNNPQGTLGLLLNDASLYNNLNSTMRDADSLLVNFKAHPKRYVHFSIFGKKDK